MILLCWCYEDHNDEDDGDDVDEYYIFVIDVKPLVKMQLMMMLWWLL